MQGCSCTLCECQGMAEHRILHLSSNPPARDKHVFAEGAPLQRVHRAHVCGVALQVLQQMDGLCLYVSWHIYTASLSMEDGEWKCLQVCAMHKQKWCSEHPYNREHIGLTCLLGIGSILSIGSTLGSHVQHNAPGNVLVVFFVSVSANVH